MSAATAHKTDPAQTHMTTPPDIGPSLVGLDYKDKTVNSIWSSRFITGVILGIGIPTLLISLLNTFFFYSNNIFPASISGVMIANTIGSLLFLVMLVLFFRFTPAIDMHFILTWSLPLIVISSVLLSTSIQAYVGVSLLVAARMLVDQFRWIYTAKVCRETSGGVIEVFGVMCALYQGITLLGAVLGTLLLGTVIGNLTSVTTVSIIVLGFICAVLLYAFAKLRPILMVHSSLETPEAQRIREIAEGHALSPRELQILIYLLRGRNAQYIRDKLIVSINTVNSHIKHIYAKHDVHSRQELIDLYEVRKDGMKEAL
jgi:DNA-binding CsgD family transcriptional regulator